MESASEESCKLDTPDAHLSSSAWQQFKEKHEKVYANPQEEARRFKIFMATKQRVDSHNADASASYTLGLNHMADWTAEERARLNGFRLRNRTLKFISGEELDEILGSARDAPPADEFDGRQKEGEVGDAKEQEGSCWTFANATASKGQELAEKMKSMLQVREQKPVARSSSARACGCGMKPCILENLSEKLDDVQPKLSHRSLDERRHTDSAKFFPLELNEHKRPSLADQATLKKVLANYGPMAVALQVPDEFYHYEAGVWEAGNCSGAPNHAVLLVGYGKDPVVGDFWIAENSWGPQWGEGGFFRMKRGKNVSSIAFPTTNANF